jgi:hypothetical protein
MNLIYFYKFSVSFHHCDEFDVFFVPDAVPGLRTETADTGRTKLADEISNMGGLLELL